MTAAGGDGAARTAGGPPDLGAAVRAALGYLADLSAPAPAVRDGRVDHMLRSALTAHGGAATVPGQRRPTDEAAAAVRTACAHLAAAELEDAYLALRAAVDRLPRSVASEG
ncbi:MAG: hypothetical protein K0S40_328 [Actinomycetospora sp.]|nr:hypothetical protein [Actinomycetospora sp.]